MNTQVLVSSFKKEIWEFNKTLFWVPLIIAVLMVLAPMVPLILLEDYQIDRIFAGLEEAQQHASLGSLDKLTLIMMTGLFSPFIMIALLVQLYYFTACLFDERRDLSAYFWRSLPVSDATTIGVKLITGALLIPAIFMLGATLALLTYVVLAFIGCVVLSLGYDISLWQFWGDTSLVSSLLTQWSSLIPYALWMFPVFAWLMLASMFAKKAPFLWAVLPLVALLLVEAFITEYFQLGLGFMAETLMNYFTFTKDMMPTDLVQNETIVPVLTMALFAKVEWLGLLFGGVLMYATYWLRVNRSQA